MSKIVLPGDPDFNDKSDPRLGGRSDDPVVMGDVYAKGLTPKTASEKHIKEIEEIRGKDDATFKYASSQITHLADNGVKSAQDSVYNWMKNAQAHGVSNVMANPMWFSPLHTPQNWQVASKRREIYQWALVPTDTNSCQITTCDYTCRPIKELNFLINEVIEDTVTGGILYDNIKSEKILSGSGVFRSPPRYSIREMHNKRCFAFHVYGYWRDIGVSEEHPQIVLDGKLYRHKKKIESNARYRRDKGIVPNGVEKVKIPNQLISHKEAQEVSDQDYLLAPVPQMGHNQINTELAWMLGLAVADGYVSQISNEVNFTIGKYEKFKGYLEDKFSVFGKVRSKTHTSSKVTQRITIHNKECHSFFAKYITGKLTEKCFTKELFDLSKESRLHILGGYFDGDGSFSKAEGKLIANNYSKDMADQLYWLLLSVGIRASLGRYPLYGDHYETDSKWVYRLYIPQSDILKLKPYMRSNKIPDDFTPRNVRDLRFFYEEDGVTYLAQPIESIKQFRYTGPGYDLQIDPERSFVASGFVTSNCRFFMENEPKVGAAIDFYANFPMNGFDLVCENPKILNWFDHHVVKRLDINEQLKMISREFFSLGDVFVHTDIECPECKGSGADEYGDVCNHPGGTIRRLIVLNPDWIEVQQNVLADEPSMIMIPDDELKRIVFYQQPKNIYERIPDTVKDLVRANQPIPLSNRVMSHIKHMPVPYGTYGTSLIRRLFTTLAYKTKIMTANWIVAERLILPVRVVKIGSDNRPASSADIADIQQQLAATANDPNLTIVTHHNFDYDWYGCLTTEDKNSRVMTSRGLVHYSKLTEKDLIATWNAETGKIEYQKYIRNIEFVYNKKNSSGVAYKVGNRDWMGTFTPNHRHYLTNGEIKRSDELSVGDEIVKASQWKWQGSIPVNLDYKSWHGFNSLSLEEFCRFAGYFVTEGHVKHEKTKNLSSECEAQAFAISQNVDADFYNDIKDIMFKLSSRCYVTTDERRVVPNHQFNIANAPLSRILKSNFGSGSTSKHLPDWLLQLPKQYLEVLLKAMIDGDGDSSRNRFSTVSVKLKDQFMEILTKLGFSPYCSVDNVKIENRNNIFRILWSSNKNPRKFKISKIETVDYEGNMWCLEMPNKNFFVEIEGHILLTGNTSGKVLQITQELEHIDKEILDGFMLNQSLLNGEMCIPEEDRMLTKDGFKNLKQISEDDEIATFNKETGMMEYQKPTAIHQYDWDGDLVHFQTDRIDFACTPNHRMLYQKRDHDEWVVGTADNVKDRAKFIKTVEWQGSSAMDILSQLSLASWNVDYDDMMKIVAYYVTEGYCPKETRKERTTHGEVTGLHIAQTEKGKGWKDLCGLKSECTTFDIKETRHGFAIYNKEFAKFMSESCGRTSYEKKIPQWIKDQNSVELRKFLGYMINGDGALRTRDKHGPKKYYTYYTKSDQLKDDVTEIALKCGYFPRFRKRKGTWEVTFSDYDLGQKIITLESKKHKTITKLAYKGKVWCVTVPNSFIVTERNGKLMVSGNSGYQSAQVGVETLIRRIESWRHTLAHWVEEKIFKPISEMQGFLDEAKTAEFGENVYLYPTIKWNDLNLKDKTQWHQLLMQLHDKQVISTQTLCEELDLDYDQEVQRMRYEQATGGGPMGGMMGGAGGAGGDMGMGMGGMGGGMDGGMGMDPMVDPAAAGAMGGAGAGDMMGGDMGMGPMAGGAKVMKKGKGKSDKDQDMPDGPAPMIKLTSIEQNMARMIENVTSNLGWSQQKIAQNIRLQFPVQNPKGHKAYRLDFAIPRFKLGIEADGDYFHNRPEQIKSDQERDQLLAQRGWTILRFDDKTINEVPQKVEATILSYIKKAEGGVKEAQKKPVILYTTINGELKDISSEYERYIHQIHKINYSEVHHKNGLNKVRNQSEFFE